MPDVDLSDPEAIEEWLAEHHTLVIDKIDHGDIVMHLTCAAVTDACRTWDLCWKGRCQEDVSGLPGVRHGKRHRLEDEEFVMVEDDDCSVVDNPIHSEMYGRVLTFRRLVPGEYAVEDWRIVTSADGTDAVTFAIGKRLR